MDLRGDDFQRSARAPAKLNLFLEVLARREDGFHDLETVMVPIRLADQLTFTPLPAASNVESGRILFNVRACWPVCSPPSQANLPTGPDNLVVKSLELLRERSGCSLGARIELIKRIPLGAGLGGGSSDAAAALRLANRRWRIHWSQERLAELATELGSDIPFFLSNGPAICRGRGERVEPLPPLPLLHFVIVKPKDSLSSGDVYRTHDSLDYAKSTVARGQLNRLIANLYLGARREVGRWMHNCLQTAARSLSPGVEMLHRIFSEFDFVGHQLTGSGSAYFGVCRHAQHARRLASILRTRQLGLVYATRSCH
jgi:4-diphosphocytidyl-2-C-methyl-D-erythritol kinase